MQKFMPIFPLGIVVFPGENLNLHIFEPRYIELINDIQQSKKTFEFPFSNAKTASDSNKLKCQF